MVNERVLLSKPSITPLELEYVADAAANAWGSSCYRWITRFEQAFANYLGVPYAVATSSGTGAMHLGLAALGVGPGDEVILADTNWIATVAPVVHLGAQPVLVDIDPQTWCIAPQLVEEAITPKTRAIIATHLYGNACDVAALQAIAERHGVTLIEDAAEALGTSINGQLAGSLGRFGIFSFHGSKTITTGEGGMWVGKDPDLYARVQQLNQHGRAPGDTRQFWPSAVGYKFRMTDLQAAMGCAQLERIGIILERKRAILQRYRELLADVEGVSLNPEPVGVVHGAWMPTVVFDSHLGLAHQTILGAFAEANVDARPFFWPLSALGVLPVPQRNGSRAADIQRRAVNLPSYVDMSDAAVRRVADVIRQLVLGSR